MIGSFCETTPYAGRMMGRARYLEMPAYLSRPPMERSLGASSQSSDRPSVIVLGVRGRVVDGEQRRICMRIVLVAPAFLVSVRCGGVLLDRLCERDL